MNKKSHKFKIKSIKNKNIVFTLTPTSIIGSIVTLVKDEKPKIFFSAKERLVHEEEIDDVEFVKKYLAILDKICLKIIYKLDNNEDDTAFLDSAYVFITDPWLKSKIYNFSDEKVIPFSADEKYFEKITQDNDESFETYKNYISSKANGYDINLFDFIISPNEDKKIKKIEINILEQKVQKNFIEMIKYTISKNFVLSDIVFNSQTNAVLEMASIFFPNKKDKIVVVVYEEFTIMQVYVDSRLDSITKIPLGTNKVIKKIKEVAMLKDYNHAIEIFDRVRVGETFNGSDVIKKILNEYKREYVYYLNKTLSTYKRYKISPNILVISDDKRSILMTDEKIFGSNVKKIDYDFVAEYIKFSNIKYFDMHSSIDIIYLSK